MTTLDRPCFAVLGDAAGPPRRLRRSIFVCEPRYRVVRAVITVKNLKAFIHPQLRRLMAAHWNAVRTHSSWSRA